MKKYSYLLILIIFCCFFVFLFYNHTKSWNQYQISIVGIGNKKDGINTKTLKNYLNQKKKVNIEEQVFFQYELHLSNKKSIFLTYDLDQKSTILEWDHNYYQITGDLYQFIKNQIEPNQQESDLYLRLGIYEEGNIKGEAFERLIQKRIAKEKKYQIFSRNNFPKIDDDLYYVEFEVNKTPYLMIVYYVDQKAYLLDFKENEKEQEQLTIEEYAKFVYQSSVLTKEHSH